MLSACATHPSFNTLQKIGLSHMFETIECTARAVNYNFTHCSLVFLISVAWMPLFSQCFTDGSVCSAPLIYTASHISFHVHHTLAQQWIGFVLCTSETLNLERVTMHSCLWLQLNVLFKLGSFPWDGSNILYLALTHCISPCKVSVFCRAGFEHVIMSEQIVPVLFFSVSLLSCYQ